MISFSLHRLPQGQVYQSHLTDVRLRPNRLNDVPTARSKQVNLDSAQGHLS